MRLRLFTHKACPILLTTTTMYINTNCYIINMLLSHDQHRYSYNITLLFVLLLFMISVDNNVIISAWNITCSNEIRMLSANIGANFSFVSWGEFVSWGRNNNQCYSKVWNFIIHLSITWGYCLSRGRHQ